MIQVEVQNLHTSGSYGPDEKTVSGVKRLMKAKLASIGADGVWTLWAIKRDSPKPTDLHVKGLYSGPSGSKSGVKCIIRPSGGGDMSWEYLVEPPPIYSLSEVQQKLKGKETITATQVVATEKQVEVPGLVRGRVYEAEITGVKPFGFLVKAKGAHGLLPLDQMALVYDKENIKRWRVGEMVKVLCTSTEPDVRFSRAALLAMNPETSDVGKVYLGVPDGTGTLSMEGFIDNPERKRQLLVWLVELQKQEDEIKGGTAGDRTWMPYEVVAKFVGDKLKEQSGATNIHSLALASIFRCLVPYEWLEIEDKQYRVTEWGIEESASKLVMPKPAPEPKKEEEIEEPPPTVISTEPPEPVKTLETPLASTAKGMDFRSDLLEYISDWAEVKDLNDPKAKDFVLLAVTALCDTAVGASLIQEYCKQNNDIVVQAGRFRDALNEQSKVARKLETLAAEVQSLQKDVGISFVKVMDSVNGTTKAIGAILPIGMRSKTVD